GMLIDQIRTGRESFGARISGRPATGLHWAHGRVGTGTEQDRVVGLVPACALRDHAAAECGPAAGPRPDPERLRGPADALARRGPADAPGRPGAERRPDRVRDHAPA